MNRNNTIKSAISASLLCSDLSNMGKAISEAENGGVDYIHFDVMDGVFVEDITFGMPIIKSILPKISVPADIHLMVQNPGYIINCLADEKFPFHEGSIITIHAEIENVDKHLEEIRKANYKTGLAFRHDTNVTELYRKLGSPQIDLALIMTVIAGRGGQGFMQSAVKNIAEARKLSDELAAKNSGKSFAVGADGGINNVTAEIIKQNGADFAITGSYLFNYHESGDIPAKIELLKSALNTNPL
jgi:ribulose-phosphate 3-epimerase